MRDIGGALDQYIFPDRFLFITNFDDTGSFQYIEEDIDRCDYVSSALRRTGA